MVQVVNPTKKADYTVRTLGTTERFHSHIALQNEFSKSFPDCDCSAISYIIPGHGLKGKKMKISSDEDIQNLYHHKRKRITFSVQLSCAGEDVSTPPTKRRKGNVITGHDEVSETTEDSKKKKKEPKRQSKSEEKLSRVQKIVEKLKEIHGSKHTIEKLNCWAHMLDMDEHNSYDEPPKLPFFGGTSRHSTATQSIRNPTLPSAAASTMFKSRHSCRYFTR